MATKDVDATPAEILMESLRKAKDPRESDSRATSAIVILIEDAPTMDHASYTLRHCGMRLDEVISMLQIIRADLLPGRLH